VTSFRRWLPALFVLVALGLLPWTLWLATTLPSRHVAEHWDVAWGGFDVILSVSLTATAVALALRHRLLQGAAMATGALLVADAWFDVSTAQPGDDLLGAVVLAVAAELPLAALLFWVALDPHRFYARVPWSGRAGERQTHA
jgi:hypothetical protein